MSTLLSFSPARETGPSGHSVAQVPNEAPRLPPALLSAVSPSPSPVGSVSKFYLLPAHFPPWPVLPRGPQRLSAARRRHPPWAPCRPLSPASFSTGQPECPLRVIRQMTPLGVKASNASLCSRNKNPNPCRDLQVPTRLGSNAAPLTTLQPLRLPSSSLTVPAEDLTEQGRSGQGCDTSSTPLGFSLW